MVGDVVDVEMVRVHVILVSPTLVGLTPRNRLVCQQKVRQSYQLHADGSDSMQLICSGRVPTLDPYR